MQEEIEQKTEKQGERQSRTMKQKKESLIVQQLNFKVELQKVS